MIVQVNHVPRLKYGQWLDIRQAGRVGWGSEEWGINNRTLGVDCHFKLEGVGCFYELRSKTWANSAASDRAILLFPNPGGISRKNCLSYAPVPDEIGLLLRNTFHICPSTIGTPGVPTATSVRKFRALCDSVLPPC